MKESQKKVIVAGIIVAIVLIIGIVMVLGSNDNEDTDNNSTEDTIQDTVAPVVKFNTKVITIDDFSKFVVDELIESVVDDSDFEKVILGYEKIGDVAEATEEYLETLEKTENEKVVVEGLATEVPSEEGIYRVVISFKDEYNNETLSEVFVVYDEADVVVEEVEVEEVVEDTKDEETVKEEVSKTETEKDTASDTTSKTETTVEKTEPTITSDDVEELGPGQKAALEAGYYNVVAKGDGGYCVLVHMDEFEKGRQLIDEYLESLGLESCGYYGAAYGDGKDHYLVSCEAQEKIDLDNPDNWR